MLSNLFLFIFTSFEIFIFEDVMVGRKMKNTTDTVLEIFFFSPTITKIRSIVCNILCPRDKFINLVSFFFFFSSSREKRFLKE